MATTKPKSESSSWIFDEQDQSGVKTQKKLVGEKTLAMYEEITKVTEGGVEEMVQKIKDAKFEDIADMTNAFTENISAVLGSILQNTREVDKTFEDLMKLNPVEQGLKDDAVKIVKEAEAEIENVKNWGAWKRFWSNQKKALTKRNEALENAKIEAVELEKKALMLFDKRQREAGLDQLLPQYRHMSSIIVNKLNAAADVNMQQYDDLEIRHEGAIADAQRAAKELEKLNKSVQDLEVQYQTESKNLLDNFTVGSSEYTNQKGIVDEVKQKYDEARAAQERMQAAYNSKEKFSVIIQTTMTALKMTAGKMRALATGLRSDTEEREHTYPATIQMIKANNTLQSASNIDKVGHEADNKTLQIATSVASAADKDSIERLYQHPKNMQTVLAISAMFDKMIEASKRRWDEYRVMIAEGYDTNVNKEAKVSV